MQTKVGETAGKIWEALAERGEVSISRVPNIVSEKLVITYQALGWLAREGKIKYSCKGNGTYVSLP
ncbi:MAG: winged helix-turn-helix domain-containing protein [candidate division Zixibacteria bacterium]|nr:winged helix-turn-helix domain-containing protein [candidate division Zixibacteria bacterium]MDH3938156.1 winged helix-turn-helix domain-containing protein [candidate division Zixibacteria bacterium]MDH4033531.1 winged helix-turn-helix domain-containing protein [candidate division Zixibacteria bacterium]